MNNVKSLNSALKFIMLCMVLVLLMFQGDSLAAGTGTCTDNCGGKGSPADCWCDDKCEGYGDCCNDYPIACPPPADVGCGDNGESCGDKSPDGCWCDDKCEGYGDCCDNVNSYDDKCKKVVECPCFDAAEIAHAHEACSTSIMYKLDPCMYSAERSFYDNTTETLRLSWKESNGEPGAVSMKKEFGWIVDNEAGFMYCQKDYEWVEINGFELEVCKHILHDANPWTMTCQ